MDLDSQRFALRKCRYQLQKETLPELVIYLHQEEIISDQDKERIQQEPENFNQNDVLFDILSTKGQRLFSVLEGGYKKCEQIHLMELLKYTANNYTEETERDDICTWLKDNYQEVKDHVIPLDDLFNHFEISFRFTVTHSKLVEESVKQTFKSSSVIEGSTKNPAKILNIAPTKGVYVIRAAVVDISAETSDCSVINRDMTEWSVDNVKFWLKSFKEDELDSAVDSFGKDKINGKVLAKMDTSDHDRGEIKKLPYGTFRTILIERDEFLQKKEKQAFQLDNLRPFGQDKKSYKNNAQIIVPVSNADTKCLHPVHNFVEVSNQQENDTDLMAMNILQFANACMNSRVNGTIHFGLSVSCTNVQVIGVSSGSFALETAIQKKIKECAFSDQMKLYSYCIGCPCYIEVSGKDDLYVVEVDIIPVANLCGDRAFHLRESPTECHVYGILAGKPQKFSKEQQMVYYENKEILHQQRDTTERKATKQYDQSYLKHRLVNLLCIGDEKMAADIYPVLFLDKPSCSETKETFSFIQHIKWTAIFDFDSDACIYKFLDQSEGQNFRVLCVEEFKETHDEHLQEELRQQPWIFTNGFADIGKAPSKDIKEWTRERNNSFHSAVRYLSEQIPPGRAVFVFLRFGDSDITNEAASHCSKCFPDQFVILAREECHIEPLKTMLQTYVDQRIIEKRSLVGIQWNHLQNIILDITGHHIADERQIPVSSGARCSLSDKIINQWTDLDILLANECDREPHIVNDTDNCARKGKKVQEDFYHGRQVLWWNFWFSDQVLHRSIHNDLRSMVNDALLGRVSEIEDSKIKRVTLYHQPGSGATTTARHILWELRTQYRCAVINNITSETAKQIFEYRKYQDSSPKPVLILLDNPDEEKSANLTAWLEENAKLSIGISNTNPWFVFLMCKRNSEPPQDPYGFHKMMKQELIPREKVWFQEKYKQLEKIHRDNNGPDPKYLLSFNILKNDFNEDHIRQTVQQLVKDVKTDNERLLLKYVAFLNHFHIRHRYVPLAVFDRIMTDYTASNFRSRSTRYTSDNSSNCWETQLCHASNIMLDRTSGNDYCHVQLIGIIHPLLSKEVLFVLKEKNSETIGDLALEFLGKKYIFTTYRKGPQAILLKLVKEIFIMREKNPDKTPVTKFAPLIEHIRKEESQLIALKVYRKGHELTNNAMVAQQIARFHITEKDWDEASKYATYATEALPGSSYLWDTHAQVYREKLNTRYDSIDKECERLSADAASELIGIAEKAVDKFKQEQVVSDKETQSSVNLAGYHGAIRTFVTLMNCLTHFESFYSINKTEAKCLIWERIQSGKLCQSLSMIQNCSGKNNIEIIKQLGECAMHSYMRLADENVQLRDRNQDDRTHNRGQKVHTELTNIKAELNPFFGRSDFMSNECLSEQDMCLYRRRLVFALAGPSLYDILNLKDNPSKLHDIKKHMMANIETPYASPLDYQKLISSVLVLMTCGEDTGDDVSFKDLMNWSRTLFERRETSQFIILEAYLYFVMFHWPRENIKVAGDAKQIKPALQLWRDAYFRKFPRQAESRKLGKHTTNIYRKKETVMFFFSQKEDMHSIALYERIQNEGIKMSASQFWQNPVTRQNLQRFRGILGENGRDVLIWIQSGLGKDHIRISTSRPVENTSLYNKPVFFFLAFSWIGPKAYDVTSADQEELPAATTSTDEKPRTDQSEWSTYRGKRKGRRSKRH